MQIKGIKVEWTQTFEHYNIQTFLLYKTVDDSFSQLFPVSRSQRSPSLSIPLESTAHARK